MIGGGGGYTVGPAPQDSAPQQPVPQPPSTPLLPPGLGPEQCDIYERGGRADLVHICNRVFGNSPTERCVRECLQNNFNPRTGHYIEPTDLGPFSHLFGGYISWLGIATHIGCIAKCTAGG